MTKRPLILVCPMLPPMRGGLPDHTARLALELSQQFDVTVVSSTGTSLQDAFRVLPVIDQWQETRQLEATLAGLERSAPILWQYVPHMYGRGGVNRHLPRLMERLQRQGKRQIVIAHEIAAGLSWRPHWLWFALNHRWQWRRIVDAAHVVPISTERWVEQWTTRLPKAAHKFFTLPSPSSIPRLPVVADHPAQWRLARQLPAETRIMAYFGTVSAAKQLPWVTQSWEAAQTQGTPTALVVIGASPKLRIRPGLEPFYLPMGFLPPAEVSKTLSASDILCLPFVDGVSERRTTFMAGLDHGIAISSTYGHNTGETLRHTKCLSLCHATDHASFIRQSCDLAANSGLRKNQAAEGKLLHDRQFSWEVVAEKLADSIANRG